MLSVHKLTMRFGGLTAVSDVDLEVPKGSIFSVIGPNGAGKTTLFNAITGIYEPTAGTITCNGSDMRRRHGTRVDLACVAIGIVTGLVALLLSLDVNQLWRVVVTRNMYIGHVWEDLENYMAGHLTVERWKNRWAVVPWNNSRPILASANFGDARAIADFLDQVIAGKARLSEAPEEIPGYRITASSETLAVVAAKRRAQLWLEWIATILGFVVGTTGSFAIWNRSRRTPDVIANGGIARTFQNIRLLSSMTVLENVQVAGDRRLGRTAWRWMLVLAIWLPIAGLFFFGVLPAIWGRGIPFWRPMLAFGGVTLFVVGRTILAKRRDEAASARQAFDILGLVGLQSRASSLAGSLAYGQQRRLEIARALALKPKLLLLDEPAAGMNPAESTELNGLIRRIRDTGITVMLIEHHMNVVMGISDRIAVLDHGVKIAEGTPAEVRANPKVVAAYLGQEETGNPAPAPS